MNSTRKQVSGRPSGFSGPAILVPLMCLAAAVPGWSMETDQFTNRRQPLADSTAVLNSKVNDALEDALSEWGHLNDEVKLTAEIYQRLGGRSVVDRLERWALRSEQVEKIRTPRSESIYGGLPVWVSPTIFLFGIGATIKINGVLIGTDKIGHFFSQGRKFYLRYRRFGEEDRAARRSEFTERAIFGSLTTGIYSNADLVANYEGYRFYRSLFEPDLVAGKRAILEWSNDGWVMKRRFDWADHVNPYWDEARNVSDFSHRLLPRMVKSLRRFCPDYRAQPALYALPADDHLNERYSGLKLRDTSTMRLEGLCLEPGEKSVPGWSVGNRGGTLKTGVSGHR